LSPPPAGEPPHYVNRIHRDDCAGAIRHLLLLDRPQRLYLGVDHEPADRREVARWLADRLDSHSGDRSMSSRDPATRARSNKRCSNGRLVRSGYRFLYPTFREGFEPLLDEAG
jgi:nucleoside-diphosphate-sugar epimerase